MRMQIAQTVIVLAGLMFFGTLSEAGVVGSKHDFTQSTGGSAFQDADASNQQVCVYCHTPHSSVVADRTGFNLPLWNRSLNETPGAFTMYGSATFDGQFLPDNLPTGPSLLCLSCHDGVSSLGGAIHNPGSNGPIAFNYNAMGDFPMPPFANPVLGTDLSDDHPVSFEYDSNLILLDNGLRDPQWVKDNTALKLTGPSGWRLECTTCHDPHDYGDDPITSPVPKTPFLRVPTVASEMCTSCHLK